MHTKHTTHGILVAMLAAVLMSAGAASAETTEDCRALRLGSAAAEDCGGDAAVQGLFAAVGATLGEHEAQAVLVLDADGCLLNGESCTPEQRVAAEETLQSWGPGTTQFSAGDKIVQLHGCFINVGTCYGGCFINVGTCYGGPCFINVGYCSGWGGCFISVGVCKAIEFNGLDLVRVNTPLAAA